MITNNYCFNDLEEACRISKRITAKIKETFPEFNGYLVFSSRFGQSPITEAKEVLKEFPEMFGPFHLATDLLFLLAEIADVKDEKKRIGLETQSKKLKDKLAVSNDVFLEIRFNQLNYELIRKLKNSIFADRTHTASDEYSIRIVICKVNELNKFILTLGS